MQRKWCIMEVIRAIIWLLRMPIRHPYLNYVYEGRLIRVDVTCWDANETTKLAIGRMTCNVYESPWRPEELYKHLLPNTSEESS